MTIDKKAINTTKQAIEDLSNDSGLIDLRSITRNFIQQRLSNTGTVEELRAKALARLNVHLEDQEKNLSVNSLLEIIETLNNNSKEDVNAIIKAQIDQGRSGSATPSSNSHYNIFFNESSPQQDNKGLTQLSTKDYQIIEGLVTAAEVIVSSKKNDD